MKYSPDNRADGGASGFQHSGAEGGAGLPHHLFPLHRNRADHGQADDVASDVTHVRAQEGHVAQQEALYVVAG